MYAALLSEVFFFVCIFVGCFGFKIAFFDKKYEIISYFEINIDVSLTNVCYSKQLVTHYESLYKGAI